jgi:hypothetical protein
MSIASPDKLCARHNLMSNIGVFYSNDDACSKPCTGYDHGHSSQYPCSKFVSKLHVFALNNGMCAYESNALAGKINVTVLQLGKTCSSCKSNPESGKNCDFYVDYRDYDRGACAWNQRSQRRVDKVKGDLSKLTKDEIFCLECEADFENTRCANAEGYFNVRHVVDELCASRAKVQDKNKKGKPLKDLELNCLGCSAQRGNPRNCDNPFYSSTFHWVSTFAAPELGVPRVSSLTAQSI